MNLRVPQKLRYFSGRVYNTNKKKTQTKQKLSVPWQFCNTYETPATCVFCNSTEPPRRTIKIKRFLFRCIFRYLKTSISAVRTFSQCDADMNLATRKWSTEETCKLTFFVYSMLALPKKNACHCHFALFIFLMPAEAMHMPWSSCLFSLKRHAIYLLHHQMWTGQNTETSIKCQHFVGSVCGQ